MNNSVRLYRQNSAELYRKKFAQRLSNSSSVVQCRNSSVIWWMKSSAEMWVDLSALHVRNLIAQHPVQEHSVNKLLPKTMSHTFQDQTQFHLVSKLYLQHEELSLLHPSMVSKVIVAQQLVVALVLDHCPQGPET